MDDRQYGHDARSVANYLIRRGIERDAGPFTPLQVIKLTYLCHGWMLGLYGEPFSAQPVEAWKHGPVIPDVYHKVKIHGRLPIRKPLDFPFPEFDAREENLVTQVEDVYGGFTGIQLSQLTHEKDSPWFQIWHRFGRNTIIPNPLIQKHFAGRR